MLVAFLAIGQTMPLSTCPSCTVCINGNFYTCPKCSFGSVGLSCSCSNGSACTPCTQSSGWNSTIDGVYDNVVYIVN